MLHILETRNSTAQRLDPASILSNLIAREVSSSPIECRNVAQCVPIQGAAASPPPPLHGLRLPELRLRVLRLRVLRLRVNRYPHYNYGNGGGGSSDVGMGRPMGRRRGGMGGWGATEHSKPEAEPMHPGAWSWRRTRKCGIRFLERLRSAKNKMTLREEEGSKRK